MTNTDRIRRLEELLVTTRGELQALQARVDALEGASEGGEAIEQP
jgi:BMFP domain-containing protein YqiC